MNIPEGFVLVPATMLLGKEVIELVAGHCGDGDQMFGDYTDGILWIGDLEGDDGEKTHGLHIMTEEYQEEGSSTLIEFPRAELPAYDESKERELFEEWADEKGFCLDCKFFEAGNNFEDQATKWLYEAWQACAKSRARSAE